MKRVRAQIGVLLLAFSFYASGRCLVSCELGDCEGARAPAQHSESEHSSSHHPKTPASEPSEQLCSLAFIAESTPAAAAHRVSRPFGAYDPSLQFDAAKLGQIFSPVFGAFLFRQDVGPPHSPPSQTFSVLRI